MLTLPYVSAKEESTCCEDSIVKIFANGTCLWYPEYHSASHCPIDIKWFPFDSQQCDLVFQSKSYESKELNISAMSLAVVLDYYTSNVEWQLLGT